MCVSTLTETTAFTIIYFHSMDAEKFTYNCFGNVYSVVAFALFYKSTALWVDRFTSMNVLSLNDAVLFSYFVRIEVI